MDKKNYRYLKSKVSDFFCVANLRTIYESDKYDFRVSFLDFLMCIEDFYTFVYSPKLSKNSWLLFTWLRTLVRYDGYVRLSYKDVSSKFNDGKSVMMSKPTFFKCVTELESYGLVKRISNKKLFNSEYQNDVNTYIVISKIDDILPLLDGMKTQSEFYDILRHEFFDIEKKEIKTKQTKTESNYQYTYEDVMQDYVAVENVIKDFFTFLGSANKTGKIAKSRQLKILNLVREIYPSDADLSYAITQTISKGIKNEKYLLAILRNLYGGNDEQTQQDENEVDAKLKRKYKTKNTYNRTHNGMEKDQFITLQEMIFAKKSGYKKVLQKLKELGIIDNGCSNTYEQKLLDACNKLKRKEKILKEASYIRGDRMAILEEKGISEYVDLDKTFNEVIYWYYGDDESDIVPLSVIKKLGNKYPDAFCFNGAQFLNSEVY